MKTKFIQSLSILLALLLQVAPLVRSLLPNLNGLAPSSWGIILKLGLGATALLGFDAVSQASSIAISPPNATVGTFYSGTISYSGGHAGSVYSMDYTNTCLGSATTFFPGLTIVYSGGNIATVTGTPTTAGTYAFSLTVWSGSGCSGSHSDTRSTTFVINPVGGAPVAPSNPVLQNSIGQIGANLQLSGVSSGNPLPQYQWWTGLGIPVVGATNSILTITNLQLTNSGVYTLTASNSQTVGYSFGALPKANCYVSACITPGTNFTTLNYTNFAPAGMPITMFSLVTNVANATNYYQWTYNLNPSPILSTSNTLSLSASSLTPTKSGVYSITLNSSNSSGGIVSGQNYDSYWAFGYLPMFTNTLPASTNVNSGSSVTLSIAVAGTLNVYNAGEGGGYQTNTSANCVFWYQNGSNLVASQNYALGPTSSLTYSNSAVIASLTLPNVTSANAGSYTVVATNYWGSLTSSPVVLSVSGSSSPPTITAQPPSNLSLLAGQSSSITMSAAGTPQPTYQWRLNNTNLTSGGVYGGINTNTLTLASVVTNNTGSYTVLINNTAGSVTSSPTILLVGQVPAVKGGLISPNNLLLTGSTVTNLNYVVETATNLFAPTWVPINTNNTGASGAISFQKGLAGTNSFYRIKFP